jgi:hypothetical protein
MNPQISIKFPKTVTTEDIVTAHGSPLFAGDKCYRFWKWVNSLAKRCSILILWCSEFSEALFFQSLIIFYHSITMNDKPATIGQLKRHSPAWTRSGAWEDTTSLTRASHALLAAEIAHAHPNGEHDHAICAKSTRSRTYNRADTSSKVAAEIAYHCATISQFDSISKKITDCIDDSTSMAQATTHRILVQPRRGNPPPLRRRFPIQPRRSCIRSMSSLVRLLMPLNCFQFLCWSRKSIERHIGSNQRALKINIKIEYNWELAKRW